MTNAGNINNNDIMPSLRSGANVILNNPWTFLPPGTTAQRPTPSSTINYRLRFNTDDQLYEYYDATLGAWTQLQESAFTVGPFITYTADVSLPDAQNLGALANGILKQTITTGVATLNIAVLDTDYYGPGMVSYMQAPAGIKDANGNIVMQFSAVPSAINYFNFVNSVTGFNPNLLAAGADGAIGISIVAKGTGSNIISSTGNTPLLLDSGTGYQHQTIFSFANTAATRTVTFQDANGTLAYLTDIPAGTPSALTKNDDTNVTLTLGGTPATALLEAVSLTLGWTGTLSPTRGGLGLSNPTAHGILIGEGSTAINPIVLSSGQILIGSTGADPVAAAINSGTGILVGNGAGSITVSLASIASNNILANITGGSAAPIANTLTATIDAAIGSTQGSILYRNSSTWVVLVPGTSGNFLQTQGAAANPIWAAQAAPSSAALTKTDDTNVTLTLGGSPTTALLAATSLTLGWTGQLSGTRGGTGVNNGASTATYAGNLNFAAAFATSGAFAVTQTYTGITNVTFPTTGTLATTSQIPSFPLSPTNGGTGVANTGNMTWGAAVTFSGAFASTFTLTGITGVTFPTSGTLATLAGVETFTNKTLTSPKIVTSVLDTNGNVIIGLNPVASAVNYPVLQNSATGTSPGIGVAGTDTNITLSLNGKGTGGAQVNGTSAGGNAAAGFVGEVFSNQVLFASAITLTTTTTSYDITSIALTAGDYDVWGNFFIFSGVNLMTAVSGWIGTSSATPIDNSLTTKYTAGVTTVLAFPVPQQRINVSGNQTVYLSVSSAFTGTAPTACGALYARRRR